MEATKPSLCRQRLSRQSCVVVHARRGGAKLSSKVKDVPTVTNFEWPQPLQIIKYPDPRLRAVNAKIGTFDEALQRFSRDMVKAMYEDDGVGLAAPQVGVNVRLMVFNPDPDCTPGKEVVLVNPEIVEFGAKKEDFNEGCLSFPKLYGDVERPTAITVRAQNERGEPVELKNLDGFTARVFQHEFDHLQGVLFCDRMRPAVLDTLRPQLVGMEDQFAAANPGVKIQRLPAPKVFKGFGAPSK